MKNQLLQKENIYTTLEFIENLQEKISLGLGYRINQEDLSLLLNEAKSRIRHILENAKKDSSYLLTENILFNWISILKSKNHYSYSVKEIFDKYSSSNELLDDYHKVLNWHPNLDLNYFKNIDNIEKAYWFGFLLAEGHLFKTKTGSLGLTVAINVEDGILIKRFIKAIGFNPKIVRYIKREMFNKEKNEYYINRRFEVRFKDKLFMQNLMDHGYPMRRKSGKIRFPSLSKFKYELACLLGYFDGDGSIGKYKSGIQINIASKSQAFIEDIKSKFGIHYKIMKMRKLGEEGKTNEYSILRLTRELYTQMLDIFGKSLPRKREDYGRIENRKMRSWNKGYFGYSEDELKELRTRYSLRKIVELHGERFRIPTSYTTVYRYCKKWGISTDDIRKTAFLNF